MVFFIHSCAESGTQNKAHSPFKAVKRLACPNGPDLNFLF